jgi:hypothetical protein
MAFRLTTTHFKTLGLSLLAVVTGWAVYDSALAQNETPCFKIAHWNDSDQLLGDVLISGKVKYGQDPKEWVAHWVSWARIAPYPERRRGFATYNGSINFPEKVFIEWRADGVDTNDPWATGVKYGPYEAAVLSRVPPEIVKKAHRKGYCLFMSLSVGRLPIKFDWKLESAGVNFAGPNTTVARGGDTAHIKDPLE